MKSRAVRGGIRLHLPVLLLLVVAAVSCATSCATRKAPFAVVSTPAPIPHFEHVFVVVEENANYNDVIGNIADMPYLNTLTSNYGLATNYYANTHPSLNNYFYLTAGRVGTRAPWVRVLADLFPGEVAGDNVASVLNANKKTWKAYMESLPRA